MPVGTLRRHPRRTTAELDAVRRQKFKYEAIIKIKAAAFEMMVDSINHPGIKWGVPPKEFGAAVYCVDKKGKPKRNPMGTTMAIVNFVRRDSTDVIWYVEPGMEGGAIAKHIAEYGMAPSEKYICSGANATLYK